MSIRKEMLQVARLAPRLLGNSSELVVRFLRGQRNDDGGFRDRAGRSDLYYTVFGIDGLEALQADWETAPLVRYLESYDEGDGLDFVHLGCLARCWRAAAGRSEVPFPHSLRTAIAARLEAFRCPDGGYHPSPESASGSAYGAFLAYAAYQDLGLETPDSLKLVQSLKFLETEDGAWANDRQIPKGATNSTAAAAALLRNMGMPVSQAAGAWLLKLAHPQGGFRAMEAAPVPDLLSTATALHTLAGLEMDITPIQEPCLDFVDSLWTNEGAFYGHWYEEILDVEYTFYGLLALGHLSLAG